MHGDDIRMKIEEKMAQFTEEELRDLYGDMITLETTGAIGEGPFRDLYNFICHVLSTEFMGMHVTQLILCKEIARRHFEGDSVHATA